MANVAKLGVAGATPERHLLARTPTAPVPLVGVDAALDFAPHDERLEVVARWRGSELW